jgi:hypothetical protein
MKKIIICLFLSISLKGFSLDFGEINIIYQHSRRIPYNTISLKIANNKISVKVQSMEGKTGYDYSNFIKEIEISEEYFDELFQKFLNIDYGDIVEKSKNILGLDGETIDISIGTFQNKIEIKLWTIKYKMEERNTNGLINILQEVFSLFELEQYIGIY